MSNSNQLVGTPIGGKLNEDNIEPILNNEDNIEPVLNNEPQKHNLLTQTISVILPSRGLPYPNNPEFKNPIKCRAITTREELSIFGSSTDIASSIETAILSSCIIEPKKIDVEALTIRDRMYLLFQIRGFSYGDILKSTVTCPKCKEDITFDLSLKKLEMDALPPKVEESNFKDGFFDIVLPRSGDTVTLKLLTGKDEREIREDLLKTRTNTKANKSVIQNEFSFLYPRKKMIVAVNGKTLDDFDKEDYIYNLIGLDSSYLSQYLDFSLAYDISYDKICHKCANLIKVPPTINNEFFRPQID